MNKEFVYTDGSCLKNKRIKDIKKQPKGGIGCFWGDDDTRNLSEPFTKYPVTNQRTELYACIRALEVFYESIDDEKKYELTIYSDSQYTVHCMNRWVHNWKVKSWKKANGKPVLNVDLIKKLDELRYHPGIHVKFIHVKAHQKEPTNKNTLIYQHWYGNMMADKLARGI